MNKNIYNLLLESKKLYTDKEISDFLNVNQNTVKRWILKKDVPFQYYFDFARMLQIEVDYSNFSSREKDQFFTKKETVNLCYEIIKDQFKKLELNLEEYNFIEPSAGNGAFLKPLPQDKTIALDIEPQGKNILKQDFLLWSPENKQKNIVIGNPPFGLRGHTALKFINHSANFADFVCFILPQFFESTGKGNPKDRVKGFNLIYSQKINPEFYYPEGQETNVNVVFQIWSKNHKLEEEQINLRSDIKLYSLSDGGTPSSTRNKSFLNICDYYIPSTCFGIEKMKVYYSFEELPNRKGYGILLENKDYLLKKNIENIDWSKIAFVSTNGAYNLRFDLIKKAIFNIL